MAEILSTLSESLAATVEDAGKGVVQVNARGRLPASGIIWSSDGIVVTAHHVVERDDKISVGLPNGETVGATLIGRDPSTDLAVLKADAKGLEIPSRSDFRDVRVGHIVLALGRPGQSIRATLGVVSALSQNWRAPTGGKLDHYLQTDVVMYPGFSGGPLVDVSSQILGINTSALLRGVSLTISSPTIGKVVEQLVSHGKIRRGYLGVSSQPVRLPEALGKQLGQETGLVLLSVEPGSPAQKGGLLLGDTLLSLDGQPVPHLDSLLSFLTDDTVGREVKIRLVRGGEVQEQPVVVGEKA